ncbi:MAG: CBS domain-containing protein [Motiliproteus sp.]|nr:CBS domain-containing protein [Motiliproteus sp.]MCW9051878.1 CBS domain-containing protein [Motiliproteus sp.]
MTVEHLLLSDIASADVVTVQPDELIAHALKLMSDHACSSVVIVDAASSEPIGLLTERDVVRLMYKGIPQGRPVSEVMTTPILTAHSNLDCLDAQRMMSDHDVRHLIVLDQRGKLSGIVSQTDFRRHISSDLLERIHELSAVMDSEVAQMAPDVPLSQALEHMTLAKLDHIVVSKDQDALGIVTERDVTRLLVQRTDPESVTLSDVMTSPVHAISISASVEQASASMKELGIRHMVVNCGNGHMVGVLSQHRMLERLAAILSDEYRELSAQKAVESEARFRILFERLPLALCHVASDGQFQFINQRFTQLFGYTLNDLPDIDHWWQKAYPDEDYRRWVVSTWEQAVDEAAEREWDIAPQEYNVTCSNGVEKQVVISGITLGQDFLATFVDVTQQKRVEKALSTSERRFHKFFDTNINYCFMVSPDDHILDANQAALKWFGYDKSELQGESRKKLIDPSCHQLADQLFQQWLKTGLIENGELLVRNRKGETKTVLINSNAVYDDKDCLLHSMSIMTDISDQKQTMERKSEQLDELRRWHQMTLGREERILELKDEVNELLSRLGESPRYGEPKA